MSKVVLLAINAKYVHSSLSVWLLAEAVSAYANNTHDVVIVETTIHQKNVEIAGLVAVHKPDVVGVSTYIWNAGKLPDLLKMLRERLPGVVIVLGGPEASFNTGYWLENGADFVLGGEGEQSFPALLDTLGGGLGCTYVNPGAVSGPAGPGSAVSGPAVSGSAGPAQAGAPVDPYTETYFSALGDRIAYIETSRGCPFSCSFCLSGESTVRFFPIEATKEQLIKLSQSGTRTIKFVDRTFNCETGRACELFEFIIGLNTTCRFHFEVAACLFDDRALELLASAPPGRIQLEVGLQTFHEPALKSSCRHMDIEKAEKNIRILLRNQNIHVHVDLVAGLPYETYEDFQNSFDRAYTIGAHTLQLGFLKLLHGSALRAQADALGVRYSEQPPYEVTSSPWLSAEDIRSLKLAENALRHTNNKSRFLSTLKYVQHVTEMRPFVLFKTIGEAAPNHGLQLPDYAMHLFESLSKMPGVDEPVLREYMICDWLSMVKGVNMPGFLITRDKRRRNVVDTAEKKLQRRINRDEAAVLPSGKGVFADSSDRDPVTGLYRLCFV